MIPGRDFTTTLSSSEESRTVPSTSTTDAWACLVVSCGLGRGQMET